MKIGLIASDLDGTLLANDHLTVTKRTYNALKNAHDRGIKIAVATGRPLALTDEVIGQIPFVDFVIYSNGACVYDRNEKKSISKELIGSETALAAVEYFIDKPVFFEVYINGRSCYQNGTEGKFGGIGLPEEFIIEAMKTMDGYENLADRIKQSGGMEKITFYGVDGVYDEYKEVLNSFGLDVVSSLPGTMEATSPRANKGIALENICKIIKVTPDEVMSFGDAGNDCPMLTFAGYSFSMANGTDECKAAAKFAAPSNSEDGVAKMIEKYCFE